MNSVRIIGGEWRRRVLRFPEAIGLRPTPDRVRETLFNWLGQDLSGLNCLDLFAGSGALGFEAASRGAAQVVLVEQSPAVCAALSRNASSLLGTPDVTNAPSKPITPGAQRLHIVRSDALKFASTTRQQFDLLFLDPPYAQGWIEKITPWLARRLTATARIYAESEAPLESCGDWHTVRRGKAGQVFYHLMQRNSDAPLRANGQNELLAPPAAPHAWSNSD
ncbi:MAG: 16S rRNA (guanine(966)-N(2))-methyltransferase RsmD [Pseudomonadota bacterium]